MAGIEIGVNHVEGMHLNYCTSPFTTLLLFCTIAGSIQVPLLIAWRQILGELKKVCRDQNWVPRCKTFAHSLELFF